MGFLVTIIEWEGVLVDVRRRYWAAHREAIESVGFQGPTEEEFWRLWRAGEPDSKMVPHGKSHQVAEYVRRRQERIDASDLMEDDEAQKGAAANLRVLKNLGVCHLATLCRNRAGINTALDRLDLWMYFDRKEVLPDDRGRRVALLRELVGGQRSALAVAGTVAFAYAASEAGCRVVGMNHALAYPKRLRQVGVDVFYESLDALTDALTRRDPELQRIGLY